MDFLINETAANGYSPYNILLDDTPELNKLADTIQKKKGKLPLFDYSEEYDDCDWYNYYLCVDSDGVKSIYFEYGIGSEYGDEIPLTDEDKEKAFQAVLNFFGGYDGYKEYEESVI